MSGSPARSHRHDVIRSELSKISSLLAVQLVCAAGLGVAMVGSWLLRPEIVRSRTARFVGLPTGAVVFVDENFHLNPVDLT